MKPEGLRLLIEDQPGERRLALQEIASGEILDVAVEIASDTRQAEFGDIFWGRITSLERSLDGAFVDLGKASKRPAFLPLEQAPEKLSQGQTLLLRVLRAPSLVKGPKVSAVISKKMLAQLACEPRDGEPRLIKAAQDSLNRFLERGLEEVVVDGLALFLELKGLQKAEELSESVALRSHSALQPLWDCEGIEDLIQLHCAGQVDLPSGGRLLVEPGQTLTAIDVDSAAHNGGGSRSREVKKINLEAVEVLSREVRLRNLSGRIVVDLLEMKNPNDRKAVERALRDLLKDEEEPCRFFPIQRSGLLEMTRRRSRAPLHELVMEPVGELGRAWSWRPLFLAFEALRALRREAAALPGKRFKLSLSPTVYECLTSGAASTARKTMEERLGYEIICSKGSTAETCDVQQQQ